MEEREREKETERMHSVDQASMVVSLCLIFFKDPSTREGCDLGLVFGVRRKAVQSTEKCSEQDNITELHSQPEVEM